MSSCISNGMMSRDAHKAATVDCSHHARTPGHQGGDEHGAMVRDPVMRNIRQNLFFAFVFKRRAIEWA